MSLKMETKTIHVVADNDFDNFVNAYFGFQPAAPYAGTSYEQYPYSFIAVQECANDTSHEFFVHEHYHTDADEDDVIAWSLNPTRQFIRNSQILDYLCHKGAIPAGTYLITVSW